MAAGFTTLSIKDASGTNQSLAVYADAGGTLYPAPTGTDALGHILGLSANPIDSNLYVGGSAITLGSAVSASSLPMVIASDQGILPIGNNIVTANSSGFARPGDTNVYAAGDLVANNTTAGSVVVPSITVARANNVGGFSPQVQLIKTSNSLTNAIFRIHFYNVLPTVTNGDNGVWLSPKAGYIGNVDVSMTQAFSDPAALGLGTPIVGSGLAFTPVSGAQTLYYLIEARAAYIPVSGETFSLNVWVN